MFRKNKKITKTKESDWVTINYTILSNDIIYINNITANIISGLETTKEWSDTIHLKWTKCINTVYIYPDTIILNSGETFTKDEFKVALDLIDKALINLKNIKSKIDLREKKEITLFN